MIIGNPPALPGRFPELDGSGKRPGVAAGSIGFFPSPLALSQGRGRIVRPSLTMLALPAPDGLSAERRSGGDGTDNAEAFKQRRAGSPSPSGEGWGERREAVRLAGGRFTWAEPPGASAKPPVSPTVADWNCRSASDADQTARILCVYNIITAFKQQGFPTQRRCNPTFPHWTSSN